jgi:hypothetical protein
VLGSHCQPDARLGRRCETHGNLPVYPSGHCREGLRRFHHHTRPAPVFQVGERVYYEGEERFVTRVAYCPGDELVPYGHHEYTLSDLPRKVIDESLLLRLNGREV